jgi:uncharacterized protein (DUF2267 family)
MTQPPEVVHASRLYQDWLTELKARSMLQTHNQSQAILRSVLRQLRRRMPDADMAVFADALPPLPRGLFVEGWRPGVPPLPCPSAADFAEAVRADLEPHVIPPDGAAADALAVIASHVAPHEARAMEAALPAALRPLWPAGSGSADPAAPAEMPVSFVPAIR